MKTTDPKDLLKGEAKKDFVNVLVDALTGRRKADREAKEAKFQDWLSKKQSEPKFQRKAEAEAAKEAKRVEDKAKSEAADALKKKAEPQEPICADYRATRSAIAKAMNYNSDQLRYARQTEADQFAQWQPHAARRAALGPGDRKARWLASRANGGTETRETFEDRETGERRAAALAMQEHARKAAAPWRVVREDFIPKATVYIDALEAEERERAKSFGVGYRQSSLIFGLRLAVSSLKEIRSDDQIFLDSPKDFGFLD